MNEQEKLELLSTFYLSVSQYYEAKRYGNDTDNIINDIWECAMSLGLHIFAKSITDNRIVSNERASQVIEQALKSDGYFECHKGTIKGERIVCRGFWNRHKKDVLSLRMALMFNMYEFVEV